MKGEERRKQLLNILSSSNNPVSGGTLAKELNVSRQIIVQDISLLRANGATIFSTNKGYLLQEDRKYSRVFKVYHTDDQVEEELSTIVDAARGFLGRSGIKSEKNLRTRLSTSLILVLVIPKEFQSTLLYLEYLKI